MNYWDLRREVAKIVPRRNVILPHRGKQGAVQEKGRKGNYHQFDLKTKEMTSLQRLLNTEEVNSFVEVSLRAAACPMPLNIDVWDGLLCPYACQYCFADAFRASLYTSFFDNAKSVGLRHCNPDFYKRELDKLMPLRGTDPRKYKGEVQRAIALSIPMRLGIRFEDFTPAEKKRGISLQLLQYLADNSYPVMINTKSDLVGTETYTEALSRNTAKAAVHVTVISADNDLLKLIEPGAPSWDKRVAGIRNMTAAGIRVVARIEPFLPFINDDPEMVEKYIETMWDAGVRNITFDTYSYSANNPGIRQAFYNRGLDFERMYLIGCDSQGLGSLMLDKFMDLFRAKGFSCSTFDLGCAPTNADTICCEVGDWFPTAGYNWGSVVSAARFIIGRGDTPTRWVDFNQYVEDKGGWLSDALFKEVKGLWNLEGNTAYFLNWATGVEPYGRDEDGIVWTYKAAEDFRTDLLKGLI